MGTTHGRRRLSPNSSASSVPLPRHSSSSTARGPMCSRSPWSPARASRCSAPMSPISRQTRPGRPEAALGCKIRQLESRNGKILPEALRRGPDLPRFHTSTPAFLPLHYPADRTRHALLSRGDGRALEDRARFRSFRPCRRRAHRQRRGRPRPTPSEKYAKASTSSPSAA